MHTQLQADVVSALALVFAFSAQGVLAQPDPADPGPLAGTVQRIEYNFGDTAFTPSAWPPQSSGVEVNAVVYYPDLSQGPYPLVVFMHGRHVTCFQNPDLAFLEWPCAAGHSPIPSYQGYEYIQQILAGWGYIVVSIGANGINAFDNTTFDLGAQARGELINHHLDRWNTWNTVGARHSGTPSWGRSISTTLAPWAIPEVEKALLDTLYTTRRSAHPMESTPFFRWLRWTSIATT